MSSFDEVKIAWGLLKRALAKWLREVLRLSGRAPAAPPPKLEPMKNETSSSQNKVAPMTNETSSAKEPRAVVKSVPKKPQQISASESVVPPNIEKAVISQLTASNKDRMSHDEIMAFMTALGVGQNDAKGTLQLLKNQTKRDYVVADDLAQIQTWIGKSWVSAKRRTYRHFDITVREQFGLEMNTTLTAELLSAELMKRGFKDTTAAEIAKRLLTQDWH